ncbi:MAG TPA: SDR family oxidoreductase [Solirubrobacteraceae bacterium]|nr:SDR family oxidoreductase [Solirubrobacteraceae bacterium]
MAKPAPRPVHGKVVAITGGARGIGRSTAEQLVREGARVAIGDLDRELTERVANDIGGETVGLELDVTDRESFAAFLDAVEDRLGPVDVLVNNAGIMPLGDFAEEDDATTTRIVDINLHGVLTGTKLAVRRMRRRRRGHVINVASMVGKVSPPGGATYVASKHAVVGLTEAVQLENAEFGIDFSIVMPVVVNTELGSGIRETRGVKPVEAQDVAAAMVEAIKFPRRDVYVPREVGAIHKVTYVLPQRAQQAVARAMRSDRVLLDIDHGQRVAYEDRAARSEPGLEPDAPEAKTAGGEPAGNGAPAGAGESAEPVEA